MAEHTFDYPTLPVSVEALAEAESLCDDILKDIELSHAKLSLVVLKASRLARLLNDFEALRIFELESSGYPSEPNGIRKDIFELGERSGRAFYSEAKDAEPSALVIYTESIERLEQTVETGTISIQAAQDPNLSISSANESQWVRPPPGNVRERGMIRQGMVNASQKLASRRTFIYNYVVRKYYELKFSGVADDVFSRIRSTVDESIGTTIPEGTRMFSAVYSNLLSQNPEDWANAAHGCRRVLQELADKLFPPQAETRSRVENGKEIEIKLGANHYINRLLAYVNDSSTSDRFTELVGSHLSYMGARLDALFGAANKGTHTVVTKEEADRCVIYTYMLVGDILSLRAQGSAVVRMRQVDDDTFVGGLEAGRSLGNS